MPKTIDNPRLERDLAVITAIEHEHTSKKGTVTGTMYDALAEYVGRWKAEHPEHADRFKTQPAKVEAVSA